MALPCRIEPGDQPEPAPGDGPGLAEPIWTPATEETFDSPEQDVIARERSTALDAAMATLPAETRTALLLSADGFTGEEIAAVIGRSHGATRTLLSRARVQVRLELEARGGVR